MKSKKIQWVWILSIMATFAIIALQGYWLYNQYVYNMQKTANEVSAKVISAWEEYKGLQENRLRTKKDSLKFYNTNYNQSSVYVSDMIGRITNWDISLITEKGGKIGTSTTKGKISESDSSLISNKISLALSNYNYKESEADSLEMALRFNKTPIDSASLTPQVVDSLTKLPWKISTKHIDSTTIKQIVFSTKEPQGKIYDAVDMYLSYQNIAFNKNELDSLIASNIDNISFTSDTLTLSSDSTLWDPQTTHKLRLKNATCFVTIPYNIIEKKVMNIHIPILPNQILQTMFWQIIITFLFLLLLIFALGIQIKTISRQMRINQLRQNFVNTTIHELKRPIQTLKAIVSYMQNASATKQYNTEVLEEARKETDNLTSYIQRLREVNEGENISDSIHLTYFDFTQLASEKIEVMKKNARKSIDMEIRFTQDPLMIMADKAALGNVLTNLFENAIKYSGNKLSIIFKAENSANNLRFSITDDGFGISQEEQSHVFEPFYRSHNTQVATLPGMGLGLSYVKMIVDAHKGSINIASKIGEGTTVTIELPQR